MDTIALVPKEMMAPATLSALPTIAEVRQRMAWMSEMRPVLLEYVQKHMDPARHMYAFENGRYTPLTIQLLQELLHKGHKPALNQDGIHNLMSLYECYIGEPIFHETREEGFYTCRATVRLISFRSGVPMGTGTGSCSTRESRYAYRWVYDRDIPTGVDKTALRSRTFTPENGRPYTRYRLDNDDLADVEATVLKMAVKRAKSAAVQALPLVSEMFAAVGDPDEEEKEKDVERLALLKPLGTWLRGLKASARAKALLAVFGEPLRMEDVQKLDEDTLAWGCRVIEIATKGGVDWLSPTVIADLKTLLRDSAAQSKVELFGESSGSPNAERGTPPVPTPPLCGDCNTAGHSTEECPSHTHTQGMVTTSPPGASTASSSAGERTSAPPRGQKRASSEEPGWKQALRAHRDTLGQMVVGGVYTTDARARLDALLEQIDFALSPLGTGGETEGENLAAAVLEWVQAAQA